MPGNNPDISSAFAGIPDPAAMSKEAIEAAKKSAEEAAAKAQEEHDRKIALDAAFLTVKEKLPEEFGKIVAFIRKLKESQTVSPRSFIVDFGDGNSFDGSHSSGMRVDETHVAYLAGAEGALDILLSTIEGAEGRLKAESERIKAQKAK